MQTYAARAARHSSRAHTYITLLRGTGSLTDMGTPSGRSDITKSALLCRCWGKQIGAAGKSHSVRFPWESPAMTDTWRKVGGAAQHQRAHILQPLPCWGTCHPAAALQWLTCSKEYIDQ